jgi:RNA polymerase sigma-70 factor (ECF subfamily)
MVAATTSPIDQWPQTIEEFDRLIELTQDELVQFATYRLGSQNDAEDVVQDVFVQAYREREKRRAIHEVRPYLFRMVRNRCTDVLRKRTREQRLMAAPVGSWHEPETGDLRRLVDELPEYEAEVIRLRSWSELSFAEIAVAVDASVPTVKSRFRYGIEKLRRLLYPQGGPIR